jgi:hypothetical protein
MKGMLITELDILHLRVCTFIRAADVLFLDCLIFRLLLLSFGDEFGFMHNVSVSLSVCLKMFESWSQELVLGDWLLKLLVAVTLARAMSSACLCCSRPTLCLTSGCVGLHTGMCGIS